MEITPGGVTMDLDRIARTLSEPADADIDRATLNTQIGALTSALEHGIPEQQFSTDDEPAEGISAAKALAIANARGQRIYTIDRSNRDEALAALRLSSNTVSEIRQAVNAGRVVTTHTDPVTVPGWQGAGYVVLDPETGSGAWLIEGGLNGGFIKVVVETLSKFFFAIAGSFVDILSFLGRFIGAIGSLKTVLRDTSRLLLGAAAMITLVSTFIITGDVGKAVKATIINLIVSLASLGISKLLAAAAFGAGTVLAIAAFFMAVIVINILLVFLEQKLRDRFVEIKRIFHAFFKTYLKNNLVKA